MKLHRPKSLTEALKKPATGVAALRKEKNIDVLGEAYVKRRETKKAVEGEIEELKEVIEARVHAKGETDSDEKRTMLCGKKFVAGITRVDPKPYIDIAKLKASVSKAQAKKLIASVVTEVVDETLFVRMVEDGSLPRDLVKKVTVCPPSTQTRFFCERIENKPKE